VKSPSATLSWRIFWLVGAGAVFAFFLAWSNRSVLPNYRAGLLFGTLLQHVLLAAMWFAFGPGPLGTRFGWSLIWVAVMGGSLGAALVVMKMPNQIMPFVFALYALWLIGQIPGWLVVRSLRLQIALPTTETEGAGIRSQFGLRHLLVFMLLICVLLGLGRAMLSSGLNILSRDLQHMALMLVGHVLVQFPLAMGALLHRWTVVGILAGLLLVAALTMGEIQILRQVSHGLNVTSIYWTNGTAAAWTLVFALAVRNCGYRLAMLKCQPYPIPGERI
jgi:hypothetical protein